MTPYFFARVHPDTLLGDDNGIDEIMEEKCSKKQEGVGDTMSEDAI